MVGQAGNLGQVRDAEYLAAVLAERLREGPQFAADNAPDPPADTIGSAMPFVGTVTVTTAIFITACRPIISVTPSAPIARIISRRCSRNTPRWPATGTLPMITPSWAASRG